jgi:hypothetical protein
MVQTASEQVRACHEHAADAKQMAEAAAELSFPLSSEPPLSGCMTRTAPDCFWPIATLSFEMTTAFTPERTVGRPPSPGPTDSGRRD